jgi:putative endonuclease
MCYIINGNRGLRSKAAEDGFIVNFELTYKTLLIQHKLMMKDYYVYIIECSSGRLYTGYTVDIEKRFKNHLTGKGGAKFTRAFKPQSIEASWKITGKRGDAMHVEAYIKSLSRKEKLILTANPGFLNDRLKLIEEMKYSIELYDYNLCV